MHLVDLRAAKVLEGARHLQHSEGQLRTAWRFPLLRAYAQARSIQASGLNRLAWRRRLNIGGLVLASLLALFGLIRSLLAMIAETNYALVGCCLNPLLVLAGMLIGLAGWINHIQLRNEPQPPDPIHPLRSRFIEQFWLTQAWQPWRQALTTSAAQAIPSNLPNNELDPGALTQQAFVRHLGVALDDSYLALARVQLTASVQADLILVGPKGVWIFAVVTDEGLKQAAQDWRMTAEAAQTLFEEKIPELIPDRPERIPVLGGLVMSEQPTNQEVRAELTVRWGETGFWLAQTRQSPVLEGWRSLHSFAMVGALLSRHQALNPTLSTFSAVELASQAARAAQQELARRLDSSS